MFWKDHIEFAQEEIKQLRSKVKRRKAFASAKAIKRCHKNYRDVYEKDSERDTRVADILEEYLALKSGNTAVTIGSNRSPIQLKRNNHV